MPSGGYCGRDYTIYIRCTTLRKTSALQRIRGPKSLSFRKITSSTDAELFIGVFTCEDVNSPFKRRRWQQCGDEHTRQALSCGGGVCSVTGASGLTDQNSRSHTGKYFLRLSFKLLRNMARGCSGAGPVPSQSKGADRAPEGDETMDYDPIIIITKIRF